MFIADAPQFQNTVILKNGPALQTITTLTNVSLTFVGLAFTVTNDSKRPAPSTSGSGATGAAPSPRRPQPRPVALRALGATDAEGDGAAGALRQTPNDTRIIAK